ncbi:hypothetical protein COCNU_contig69606291G000010 [Cocos nucifera]|nr:hypothetical protein [Cocos nucifera]
MFASSIFRFLFPTLRSFLTLRACHYWPVVPVIAPFKPIPSARRKVIGTFFGRKRGRVIFAMQTEPRSEPVLLLELTTPMHQLVKEMASGMVRILLECDRIASTNTPATATAASKKKGKKFFSALSVGGAGVEHVLQRAPERVRRPCRAAATGPTSMC